MSESLVITCGGCGQHLRVPASHFGEEGRCPRCKTPFRAPAEGKSKAGVLHRLARQWWGDMPTPREMSRRTFGKLTLRKAGIAVAVGALGVGGWWWTGREDPVNPYTGASLGGRRPFPDDDPWNQDISGLPVDPNSDALIASIGADRNLHPDFGSNWRGHSFGIPYVMVPGTQPKVPVLFEFAEESDPGPYPIPPDAPIEGGRKGKGDRHVLIVDWDNWKLYELFSAYPVEDRWRAGSGAIFDLATNTVRPAGWTSADAAGLPIFPGLVRYDEVYEQGVIPHALRFTCRHTRHAYVAPARHWASKQKDPSFPPMGMRVRLKSSYGISGFPYSAQVILLALMTYGMILADNGLDWSLSGSWDHRWKNSEIVTLKQVKGSDFEVVQMGQIVKD
jgi:hypothetical protein